MNKMILVMDKPKSCEFCRLCEPERGYCVGGGSIVDEVDGNELWGGPDYDCPLRPLPDMATPENSDCGVMWNLGWNDCLDAILEGDEDD